MRIGGSLFAIAFGAVLVFAVADIVQRGPLGTHSTTVVGPNDPGQTY